MFILEDLRKTYDQKIWINKSHALLKFFLLKLMGLSIISSFFLGQKNFLERENFLFPLLFSFFASCLLFSFFKEVFKTEKIYLTQKGLKRVVYLGKKVSYMEILNWSDIHHIRISMNDLYGLKFLHSVVLQHKGGNMHLGGHFSWQEASDLLQLLQRKF